MKSPDVKCQVFLLGFLYRFKPHWCFSPPSLPPCPRRTVHIQIIFLFSDAGANMEPPTTFQSSF